MTRRQRLAALVGCVALAWGVSGCWDQHPVETRAAVAAIGIDPGPQPGLQRYTFTFPNVTTTTSSLSSISPNQQFYTIPVVASGLIPALAAAQRQESRTLYLGQVRIVCLSTHLPAAVWRQTLTTMADSGQFVLTTWVVAAPVAQAIVSVTPPVEVVPDVGLYNALVCHCQAIRWPGRGWRVWAAVATPGVSPAVVQVTSQQDRFHLRAITVLGRRHAHPWPVLATQGWAYLTGHVTKGELTVPIHHTLNVVGLIRGTRHLHFRATGDHVTAIVQLDYSGVLVGQPGGADSVHQDRLVEAAVAEHIQRAVAAAWVEAQRTQTDPMGWHRDAGWAGVPRADSTDWAHWTLDTTVHFTLREEGVLR